MIMRRARDSAEVQSTKIVATLGPATSSPSMVARLIEAGVDVFRLNFSHGTTEGHERAITLVREVSSELDRHVAILQDLQGTKIRTTQCADGAVDLATGGEILVRAQDAPTTSECICITPPAALSQLTTDERLLIDDGRVRLRVIERGADAWRVRVEVGGTVSDRKGVHLPDTQTSDLPALTAKDLHDLEVGVRNAVDFIAISFVRSASDLRVAQRAQEALGANIPLIAKIEKPEAIDDLRNILDVAYGIMVARGDLGVELSPEKVPVAQKRMIALARRYRRPVITATHMLESMIELPVPTRAEASDIANAVYDGTDAVMLSGETAIGKYPLEAVSMAARILAEVEDEIHRQRPQTAVSAKAPSISEATGEVAALASESIGADAIVVYTQGGTTARLIAAGRPRVPVFAFSSDPALLRRIALCWGVEARACAATPQHIEDVLAMAETQLRREEVVKPGAVIVVAGGLPLQESRGTNFIKLHRIADSDVSG